MARARSDKREKAFQIWQDSNGKTLLKDIAAELGVTDTLVRKWKNQDKWDDKSKGTQKVTLPNTNSNVTNKKRNQKVRQKTRKKETGQKGYDESENPELTEKQRLFCLYYVKDFNATMAAIKAGYSKDTAHVIGCENIRKPNIRVEIKRLKGSLQEELFIDAMDILQVYMKIAFADVTEYLTFGQREQQVMGMYGPVFEGKGKNKKPVMETVNYIDLNSSKEIDGTILSEVSQGKDGIKIKLADKMKALEKLEKYFDLLPDKHKRRIEEEKLQIERERLELEKIKVNVGDPNGNSGVQIIDDIGSEIK